MTAVYFPTPGYINVAFRKEGMTFMPVFSVKYLREAEEDVCTCYLERKEIAGIAENGGQWRTTVSIREVTQRED